MKRPLGQHFLFDKNILKKIIDCSLVTSDDRVVEIGAGPGAMTKLLAGHVKEVIAIEIDRKLAQRLKQSFSMTPNVEVITADALKFPYETIKGKFKVVANIPFYITTPLLFRLLEFKDKISGMTLLLQKEVAQRIVASPGSRTYGVLSITARLYTKPALKFSVPKGAFSPPPKVDSAVVHFEIYSRPLYKMKDEAFFIKVVKTAFSQRRKTIANSLKSFDSIKEALQQSGIDCKLRPEVLSIEDFIRLAEALQ
ncbi:MAG: 16S rRNA (adenine(1518)-N(6)/adenine(1519)-N(6))-dimethyltransferase RsmA [Candidatus Mariimomonas ferrooxydans]